MDGLRHTVAYSPQTQCTIITFAVISLIKMAPLMRDDSATSEHLLQLATSATTFLESVALHSTHVPARCASMLRGLLRKTAPPIEAPPAFRPGMEDHSLPVRSSRAVTPSPLILYDAPLILSEQANGSQAYVTERKVGGDDLESVSINTPTTFTLFGTDGSTGFGQMTADQILDESFWLCLPSVNLTMPWT
ncbi:hypothetical protein CBS101457_002974 [Exobasidium rhododendri]|nr:hypothetical protein CBS101457_002974 [Exobasidium rhododendri]